MPLASGTKLGPYKIEAPLGAGGMGEVYRARDTRLDRTVAVKVLSAHLSSNPDAKRRFEREARAISSLNHPNICTLHDIGHQDGTDFLVMEYLEGETLADRLAKGPLTQEQVLRYGIEICEGLETAHKSGVIHRDLKPGNIMLTKSGAKLMDFGLAKATNAQEAINQDSKTTVVAAAPVHPLTVEGTVLGTVQYMAPEQLEGREADARSDIFALGAVLYEMASGRAAFAGRSQASIIAAILTAEPPPIPVILPVSPSPLDRLIRACMAKDPDERIQTAHDVKLQLRWVAEAAAPAGPSSGAPYPAPVPVVAAPVATAPVPAPIPPNPPPAPAPAAKRSTETLAWTIAGIAALGSLLAVLVFVLHVPLPFVGSSENRGPIAKTSGASSASARTASSVPPAVPSAPAANASPDVAPGTPDKVKPSPFAEAAPDTEPPPAAQARKPSTPAAEKAPPVPKSPVDQKPPAEPPPAQAPPATPVTPAPVNAAPVATAPPAPTPPDPAKLLQDGKAQLNEQNAQAARESFRKAAEAGNTQAAVLLGTMFAQGLGGPKSDWDAVRMFRQAADAGNARGMFNLGLMYESGRVVGVGQDNQEAAHWYKEAVGHGDRDSAYRLGMMYEEGRGVEKDLNEASRLYAKSGSADAKARLAKLQANQ